MVLTASQVRMHRVINCTRARRRVSTPCAYYYYWFPSSGHSPLPLSTVFWFLKYVVSEVRNPESSVILSPFSDGPGFVKNSVKTQTLVVWWLVPSQAPHPHPVKEGGK